MKPTLEQQEIIKAAADPSIPLIKTNACAGSGKTSTLIECYKACKPKKAMYLAFNASVIQEAKQKFPPGIMCKTLHALAYQYVIGGSKVKIENFSYRHIKEKDLEHEAKDHILYLMNMFFNSAELHLNFFDEYGELGEIAKSYVIKMANHELNPSFGFLIKWFHLQLYNGTYHIPVQDLLLLDEAGDTTGVSLEIFKLIPAKKKIMVGDNNQNIYGFMHTINGFDHLHSEGKLFHMTQSFRVNEYIALKIEKFVQRYLDPDMAFKGVPNSGNTCEMAYISRTNSAMISRMIELISDETPFQTIRKPADIFAIPLVLMNVHKPDYKVMRPELAYIKYDYMTYSSSETLQVQFKTFRHYLENHYPLDVQLQSAIKLLKFNNYGIVYDAYKIAKGYFEDEVDHAIKLTTAFTSKGLEYDAVFIEDDLNNITQDVIDRIEAGAEPTEDELTELRLAYVAASRCKYELHNARFLD